MNTIYVALGVNLDGRKELLGLWLSENEGAKFWLACLTGLSIGFFFWDGRQRVFLAAAVGGIVFRFAHLMQSSPLSGENACPIGRFSSNWPSCPASACYEHVSIDWLCKRQ